ncbi:MAG: cadherin-like domain-containing protein, partial [Candidatus Anammoximicrobium sp.]|nr:cadherin-like domain-containing protein [Candidatus Anammoximicrobium sp.]
MTRRSRRPHRSRILAFDKLLARSASSAPRRFRRLGLERLEDRRLLAMTADFDPEDGWLSVEQTSVGSVMNISCDRYGRVTLDGEEQLLDGQPIGPLVKSLTVDGGPGNDLITVSWDYNQPDLEIDVAGADGDDRIAVRAPWFPAVGIWGEAGNDEFTGTGIHQEFFGQNGDDTIELDVPHVPYVFGRLGTMDGGPGSDELFGKAEVRDLTNDPASPDPVSLTQTLSDSLWTVKKMPSYGEEKLIWDMDVSNVESAELSWSIGPTSIDPILTLFKAVIDAERFSGNATLSGTAHFRNLLKGGKGDDVLIGGKYEDILRGGDGSDCLRGLEGDDGYWFRDALSGPEIDEIVDRSGENRLDFSEIRQANPTGSTPGVRVSLLGQDSALTKDRTIQNSDWSAFTSVIGSRFDDWIQGSTKNNVLIGGDGDDQLFGEDGDDHLVGDDGLSASAGNDFLHGGPGNDKLEGLYGDDVLYGSDGNDALSGGNGYDRLFGGPGDDDLQGGSLWDIFVPGAGNDTTDARADVAVLAAGPAEVKLGPGNSPVNVSYSVEVLNSGPDCANNVTVDNRWSGVLDRPPFLAAYGTQVIDPVTLQPTGVRVIPPGFTTTAPYTAVASRPGYGYYSATAAIGVPYIQDPQPTNNRSEATTFVRANTDPVPPPQTELKTKAATGNEAGYPGYKGLLTSHNVSSDGTQVTFDSHVPNYDTVPLVPSGQWHVYYGDPMLVDVTPDGQSSGNGYAVTPSLSADGRYVAFASTASNLVAGVTDSNETTDVFVRDMVAGVTRLVSVSTAGNAAANGDSESPLISGDGRFVVFRSNATDLVPGFPAGSTTYQIYRADLQTGTVELVSRNAAGSGPGNDNSKLPIVNDDGRYVAWMSAATDLVADVADANSQEDLFLRDMTAGSTALVSINHQRTGSANGYTFSDAKITPSGEFLVYSSYATDLVDLPDPAAWSEDVFLYDVRQGTNRLVSISNDGTQAGNSSSSAPVLSDDGRYVAFESGARNLMPDFPPPAKHVYVRDMVLGVTEFGAINAAGTGPAKNSSEPTISGDGRYLAFSSGAQDLVPDFVDGNSLWDDIYVRDRQTGTTTLISVNRDGTASGNNESVSPVLSRDGQAVYFFSMATDLVADILDTNGGHDLFSSNRHVAVPDTALRYTAPAGGANQITLRKNGTDLEIVRDADAQVLASKPLADTTIVIVTGADAADDQLTVDLAAGGFFSLAGGVDFSGGAGGHDTLVLSGSVTTVRYDATGASDGFVTAETETGALPIAYTGLEPIVDETTAADRFFSCWLTSNTQIRLADDADPNNGRMVIDAAGTGAFESIAFANPTRLLSIAGGNGNDSLTVASLDNGFAAALSLAGGAGNDALDAAAFGLATTLDGGFGDDVLRGGSGDTRYVVTPGSRDELHDAGGNDTLDFSGAFAPITVDLDLQATDQTLDGGGNKLQINGQIENFVGSVYADVVWAAPLAVPRDVRAGAALAGETAFDQLRVRTHDPAASNDAGTIAVSGFSAIQTSSTFAGVSMWLPPLAVDDSPVTQIGTPIVVPVAANDTDPENDPFTVSAIAQPDHGTAVLNGDGTVSYTPAAEFFGLDQFTYTIQDLLGGSSTATVSVRVNRPPDAVDDAV